ncbi:MAG: large repetitive protein [Miltoncostaeaceae bacterium]|nr:large repetitive protein [Miltoncostaeaceae bacterium]
MSRTRRRLPWIAGALLAQGVLAAPVLAGVAFSDPVEYAVGTTPSLWRTTTSAMGTERTTFLLTPAASVADATPAEVVLLHLGADRTVVSSQRAALPEGQVARVQFVDLDGNGSEEVLVFRVGEATINVFRRVGDALQPEPDIAVGTESEGVAVGDLDGDGHRDLVVLARGTDSLSRYVRLLADGDGDLDLIAVGAILPSTYPLTRGAVLLNDGTGAFGPPGPGQGGGVVQGAGFDVTGDGVPDNVLPGLKTIPGSFGKPSSDPYAARVQIGDGTGHYTDGPKLGDVTTGFVTVAQLDGVGPSEIVIRDLFGPSPGATFYIPSLGNGTFGSPIPMVQAPEARGFVDVDGDGAVDLVDQAGGGITVRYGLPIATGSLDFGEVPIGAPAEKALVVKNDGAAPLSLGAGTLGGAAGGDYAVLENGCADKVLTAGQTCNVTLRFRPGDAGARTAEVTFTGGPEPRRFAITGVGRPAAPAVGAPRCKVVSARPEPSGDDGGTVALSAAQLRVNQRIGQAAIRRLNAVEAWLNAGIQGRDLCGGAFGAGKLSGGVASAGGLTDLAEPSLPDPRPVVMAKAGEKGSAVRLSAAQLRINQRIYQTAIRRAEALEKRLAGKLTGGDLATGALTQDKLHPRLRIVSATPADFEPARSRTRIAGPRGGAPDEVEMSAAQLRINQRIAQAAVRRANALVARLEAGLTGDAFADGSMTARNLATGVVRP